MGAVDTYAQRGGGAGAIFCAGCIGGHIRFAAAKDTPPPRPCRRAVAAPRVHIGLRVFCTNQFALTLFSNCLQINSSGPVNSFYLAPTLLPRTPATIKIK